MRVGIYGAGDFNPNANMNIDYIGVDGGIHSLLKLGITPTYVIGDFDSFDQKELVKHIQTKILPTKKDETDTEVAIMETIRLGYNQIELYGVTGGRLDHFFTVCRLLYKYRQIEMTIFDRMNKITLLAPGSHQISKDDYHYLSFFAVSKACISIDSVVYPLDHYELIYEDGLCVSNEIIGDFATVKTDNYLYCIQSKKEGNEK